MRLEQVRVFLLNWILVSCASATGLAAADASFESTARPVLETHCIRCHGPKKQKGGVDFSAVTNAASAMKRYELWRKVSEQVRAGEMPPTDELRLKPAERQALLGWVATAFDTSGKPDPGPPLVRQLTRDEFDQTVRDLLRINYGVAGEAGIPRENVVEGFANRAGGQVLEPSLMEKYFAAADFALEHLFAHPQAAAARKSLLIARPVPDLTPQEAGRKVLGAFLRRAFRRPVTESEVAPFAAIANRALAEGDAYEVAIRKAMKPALVSPHFLLRLESAPAGGRARVNDHELAVRLSYFIWSTMPDDELFASAETGKLSQLVELEKQVRRMLAHDKAQAFSRHFFEHWLQLPHLAKSLPSQNHFPTFTRSLRDAMERETRLFCDHLRRADCSVLELLEADYTFANAELARHYGLAESPKEFAQVALRPADHRGGVLGMGSVLTMTSHTDRTKPTARGKWILEVLMGTPPPPPPANAGSFVPPAKDRPQPKNFREKLAQHAGDANCVGCHRRVDPLGFALENFDAVGMWRADIGGTAVDNAGTLPGVGEFRGVDGLRKVLREKQPQFVRNLAAQTLSYALGRELSYYDEPALDRIVAALKADQYRLSRLVIEVVQSYPFQHRKSQ